MSPLARKKKIVRKFSHIEFAFSLMRFVTAQTTQKKREKVKSNCKVPEDNSNDGWIHRRMQIIVWKWKDSEVGKNVSCESAMRGIGGNIQMRHSAQERRVAPYM